MNKLIKIDKLTRATEGLKEESRQQNLLVTLTKKLATNRITYLDARLECEINGIAPLESWGLAELSKLIQQKNKGELTAYEAVIAIIGIGLPVPKILQLEAEKSLAVPDNQYDEASNYSELLTNLSFEQLLQIRKTPLPNGTTPYS